MSMLINLFGTAVRYWLCELPREEFRMLNELRVKHGEEWTNLFFDLDWLSQIGRSHWSELAIQPEKTGLVCHTKSLIEIRRGRRILEKFTADKLCHPDSLFDLYPTTVKRLALNQTHEFVPFLLMQAETGFIGKLRIDSEFIRMDELDFQLTQLPDPNTPMLLTEIKYKGTELEFLPGDTVVVKSQVYVEG
jgi:hypothetical protein